MAGHEHGAEERSGTWLPPIMVAEILGVSERTLRRHVAEGKYPVQRTGRRVRIFIAERRDDESSALLNVRNAAHASSVALARAVEALREAFADERRRTERLEARLQEIEEQRFLLVTQVSYLMREAEALSRQLEGQAPEQLARGDGLVRSA